MIFNSCDLIRTLHITATGKRLFRSLTVCMVPLVLAACVAEEELIDGGPDDPNSSPPTQEPVQVLPTSEPVTIPTSVPVPTPVPTIAPTAVPVPVPTIAPTAVPVPVPTAEPTPVPTAEPTPVPTAEPTPVPTAEPTPVPTAEPTPVPTAEPTPVPTAEPTPVPTAEPVEPAIVELHRGCNYTNGSVSLAEGEYSIADIEALGIEDNSISSFTVPLGFRVTLYDNDGLQGESFSSTTDQSCLFLGDLNPYNDFASSVKVEKISPEQVSLFSGRNDYIDNCESCHGIDGNGLVPLNPNECKSVDCDDLIALTKYISEEMPPLDPTACTTEGDVIRSCAMTTAAFMMNNFEGGEDGPAPIAGLTPLARLSNAEFVNSAKSLLNLTGATPNIDEMVPLMPSEPDVEGLTNDAATQELTQLAIAAYSDLTVAAMNDFLNGVDSEAQLFNQLDCDAVKAAAGIGNNVNYSLSDCRDDFTEQLMGRAYGRPLTNADTSVLAELGSVLESRVNQGQMSGVDAEIFRLTENIRYIMLSPQFLLFLETGESERIIDSENVTARYLSSAEIAKRVSYFITATLPDAQLLADAEAGLLLDPEVRLQHVDRLLDTQTAADQFVQLMSGWLGVSAQDGLDDDIQKLEVFLNDWYTDSQQFSELYTSPVDITRVDNTSTSQNVGVLGLRAFIASHTSDPTPGFINRGEFVTERLLCNELPKDVPAEALESEGLTPREIFEQHDQQACATCHKVFDNYGVLFQGFATSSSLYDESLEGFFGSNFDLYPIGDVSGTAGSLEELGSLMGFSETAQSCAAELFFRLSVRRSIDVSGADHDAIEQMIRDWEESGDLTVKELFRTIVASENFVTLFQ